MNKIQPQRSIDELISIIPNNAWLNVFSQCDHVTLLTGVARTCKSWHALVSDPNNNQKGILSRVINSGIVAKINSSPDIINLINALINNSSTPKTFVLSVDKGVLTYFESKIPTCDNPEDSTMKNDSDSID